MLCGWRKNALRTAVSNGNGGVKINDARWEERLILILCHSLVCRRRRRRCCYCCCCCVHGPPSTTTRSTLPTYSGDHVMHRHGRLPITNAWIHRTHHLSVDDSGSRDVHPAIIVSNEVRVGLMQLKGRQFTKINKS